MSSAFVLDPQLWSELEFGTCELGDVRRTRRLVRYATQMAEKPDASTPMQTESWAECKAAYRLFDRAEVTFSAVTAVHYQNTLQLPSGKYLAISDTTEINYGYRSRRRGLGRLTGKNSRGFLLHSAIVVDPEFRQVLGLAAQELWTRGHQKVKTVQRVKGGKRATEADVWGRVMSRVQPANPGVQFIHVCDRGADNFDVFAHLQHKDDSWVIRAAQLTPKVRTLDGQIVKLNAALDSAILQGTYKIYVNENRGQIARWAEVEVRSTSVTLLQPGSTTAFVLEHDIREVPTQVVQVQELNAPKNCKPLRWVLYTREPASSFDDCIRVIEYYERRPIVESYHQCLKTGLRIEERQYDSAENLKPVIGVICIQAVRLLQLQDIARKEPDTPAKKLVPAEWLEALRQVLRRPLPLKTVRDFLRAVASLGGFLLRNGDGEPGWKTIWRGLEMLIVALRGYRAAQRKCG